MIHDSLQIARFSERLELPVRARSFFQDLEGVFDFSAAAELVDDVVDEPFYQLSDQFACRSFPLLAPVDEMAVQSIPHCAPFVLFDQISRVHTERNVLLPQLPKLGDNRLKYCRKTRRFFDAR